MSNTQGIYYNSFPTRKGYVKVTPTYSRPGDMGYAYNYVFNYTDHLGNVRVSYSKDPRTNRLKILEENHYYPFGLKHSVYSGGRLRGFEVREAEEDQWATSIESVTKTDYQYKYNGKEFQDELELGVYDYGWRNYDPTLGRWMNIDPLAEISRRHSPYTYVYNNPLRYIDPDGMAADDVILRGKFKQEAFDQLQASVEGQLNLTMDKNGKVEATVVEGAELTEASQTLLDATTDSNIRVNIFTTDEFVTASGNSFPGGAFQGSRVNADGTVDAVNVANPFILEEIDSFFERGQGVGILHETIEGYVGAQQSPGSPPATLIGGEATNAGGLNWEKAHKETLRIDPRGQRSSGEKVTLGRTEKGKNIYRTVFLKKGIGSNKKTKDIVDTKPIRK